MKTVGVLAFCFIIRRTSIRLTFVIEFSCVHRSLKIKDIMGGFATRAMMFVGLTFIGMSIAVPTSGFENIHLLMEPEELKKVFQAEPHAIPDYEVVSLEWPRLHRRSSNYGISIRLNAFGKNIPLWLHPTEGTLVAYDTPVYLIRRSMETRANVMLSKLSDPMKIVGEMLEDREKEATLIVRSNENGRSSIFGNIGSEGWTIRPLPQRFDDKIYFRNRRSNDSPKNETIIAEYYEPSLHVIYKNPQLPDEAKYIEKPIGEGILRNMSYRWKRDAPPSIIYPQILVFVDYATYELHNKDVYGLLEYLLPFWNGVDLRYRGLEFPKVRLNIAGFVIAMDDKALPYIAKNKVGAKTLNIFGALSDFGEFMPLLDSTFSLVTYDVAISMAPFEMCSPQDSGICKPGTLGLAYLSGACDIRHYTIKKTLSVAVIQDKGAFDGMHTAAHELGHLLGAGHDGQGESLCAGHAGHIMASTPVLTENSTDWSSCSLAAFDKFFKSEEPLCLFDKPKTSSPLPRILPGRLMTMDEQCAKLEGTKWCDMGVANPCMRLKCHWHKDKTRCLDVGDAAADGSKCGNGLLCVHGKCLSERDIV